MLIIIEILIVLWNTFGECENYGLLSGHKNAVLEVHWGSNGNTICSASADKTVGLWDAKKGTRIRRLINHTGIVNTCSMASNQPQIFASGSDDRYAIVWDSRSKIPSQSIGHDYQVFYFLLRFFFYLNIFNIYKYFIIL